MPRRNNRDKRYDPKDYDNQNGSYFESGNDNSKSKPRRKRKDKGDKKIYRQDD